MKTEQSHQFVTKDMIIADVLKKYPDVAVIMLEYGLHCVGCHANIYDSVEAGSASHGMDAQTIDRMLGDINKFVAEMKKEEAIADAGPVTVTVTDAAAQKIKDLLKKGKQEGFGLRVSVMPGGCSGFVYQMSFEKAQEKDDAVLEDKGVKLFVDKDSLKMLKGAEVDYVDELNQSGFKVNNPQAKHNCGCGKSFG